MLGNSSENFLEDLIECTKEPTIEISQEVPEEKVSFHLKAAKCREDQYTAEFPPTMTCTPYKYDLKLFGTLRCSNETTEISVELVDADTFEKPESQNETRPGVMLESVEVISRRERVLRFALNWCSFHFKKRAFRLKVRAGQDTVFISTPFHTYARRRDTPYTKETGTTMKRAPCKVSKPCSLSSIPTSGFFQNNVHWPLYSQPKLESSSTSFDPNVIYLNNLQQKSNSYVPRSATSSPISTFLSSMERTSMALQLMSSLSPVERQAVNYYLQGL